MNQALRISRETEFYQGYIRFKMSVTNESHTNVRTRILGQRSDLQELNESRLRARIDLKDETEGKKNITLSSKNILHPQGFRIISIDPSMVEIVLE